MKLNVGKLFSIFLCAVVLFSCENKTQKKFTASELKENRENLIKAKKFLTNKEADEIDSYAAIKKWDMIKSGTGLRYMILKEGVGDSIRPGNSVKIKYKIFLMDGSICYDSDKDGPRIFKVEEDNIESGIHEGIQYLKINSKARMIIPSHLAHGMLGDYEKIPPLSPIVYELEVLDVKR